MNILREHSFNGLKDKVEIWRKGGLRIGFVPTMGALHAGHMALVEAARRGNDRVIVSIFVNPKQFSPSEDAARYPRPWEDDIALLEKYGADMVFLPAPEEVYPSSFATSVAVGELGDVLCGAHRPGHFTGVATVVALLLNAAQAHEAFFGEKDYQQLLIVRRMREDLRFPSAIIGVPTARAADGLALSSRNRYLSPEERAVAPGLYAALGRAREALRRGKPPATALPAAANELLAGGFRKVDYCEARHAATLALPPATADVNWDDYRLFAAAWLGSARLIDNIALRG